MTLGATLLVAAIAMVLGFSMAGLGFFHTTSSVAQANSLRARNLAESAVSRAIERILDAPTFGTASHADYARPVVVEGDGEDRGVLAFDPAVASRESIPQSLNRLGEEDGVDGWQRPVPPDSIYLVGVGRSGGVERKLEVLLYVPPFPYVVCSSGSVAAEGGLRVAAVDDPRLLLGGFDALPREEILPGHLSSNSSAEEAVHLVGESLVTGDVLASGGITLDRRAVVRGAVRPHSDPVELPVIDVSRLDPAAQGRQDYQTVGTVEGGARLSGFNRAPGRVTVDGDLVMDGAVLYVGEELVVKGGLKGKGLVAVNGPVTVLGGTSLAAENQAALVAAGNVGLYGNDRLGSSFQGLVYAEGTFQARQITLAGTFIANGRSASISLQDTDLVQLGAYTRVEVPVGAAPPPAPAETPVPSSMKVSVRVGDISGFATLKAGPLSPEGTLDPVNTRYEVQRNGTRYANLDFTGAVSAMRALLDEAVVYWKDLAAWDSSHGNTSAAEQDLRNLQALMTADPTDLVRNGGGNAWVVEYSTPAPQDPTPTATPTPGQPYTFDLNEFVGLAGRIRVLLWKEH